jgi:sigma-54 dependent transcriptional regulator, acetoin dehydrogenase operon transcriptional activator AcoR
MNDRAAASHTLHALPWHATPPDEPQRLALARQRFFADGVHPAGQVAEPIWRSWQRCLQKGLQPARVPALEPVSRSRISYLAARDHLLLKAAQQPFDELQAAVARSGCKVLLTDRDGVLLRVTPARREESAVMHAACRVGVDLREGAIGTTAPSLAAHGGRGCSVRGGEHFHELFGRVFCAAAPIRNRHGAVVAVLDLSIDGQPFGFDARWLVQTYAGTIEDRLRIAQTRQQVLLRLHSAPGALQAPGAGLAAVDEAGRIGWLNAAAAGLIGVDGADARQFRVESLLGCDLEQLLQMTHSRAPQPVLLPNGLTVWLQAEFRPLGDGDDDAPPAPPPAPAPAPVAAADEPAAEQPATLAQLSRQLIEQTLADCRGNVSQAARRLGVSRGLLYRRLRGD